MPPQTLIWRPVIPFEQVKRDADAVAQSMAEGVIAYLQERSPKTAYYAKGGIKIATADPLTLTKLMRQASFDTTVKGLLEGTITDNPQIYVTFTSSVYRRPQMLLERLRPFEICRIQYVSTNDFFVPAEKRQQSWTYDEDLLAPQVLQALAGDPVDYYYPEFRQD